jgi:tellurite resistance protein TehA-like permease
LVRVIVFWLLFTLGTLVLIFALGVSHMKATDRSDDIVVFSISGVFLLAGLLLGRLQRGIEGWRIGPVLTGILSVELILCLYGLVTVTIYQWERYSRDDDDELTTNSLAIVAWREIDIHEKCGVSCCYADRNRAIAS